jgi:glucose 1-dehydrogenase
LAIGICGTDLDIVEGEYGSAPEGRSRLVIGHESLGVVESAPSSSGFAAGDHIVGIVRRPDPVPCTCCAADEWDQCSNGLFVERGIEGADGYAAERFVLDPHFAVKVATDLGLSGVLLEPASILAKVWRQIDEYVSTSCDEVRSVLVTGAGPIGMLAAAYGVQRGFDVHVLDLVDSGPKPDLVKQLGATYHSSQLEEACPAAAITIECTGVGDLAMRTITNAGPNGIVCLTGVSEAGTSSAVDTGLVNREMVLGNKIVFGSVSANRADYEAAATSLSAMDPSWRAGLITRKVSLDGWEQAYEAGGDDVKTALVFD